MELLVTKTRNGLTIYSLYYPDYNNLLIYIVINLNKFFKKNIWLFKKMKKNILFHHIIY